MRGRLAGLSISFGDQGVMYQKAKVDESAFLGANSAKAICCVRTLDGATPSSVEQ
jgi:hypothetical protein